MHHGNLLGNSGRLATLRRLANLAPLAMAATVLGLLASAATAAPEPTYKVVKLADGVYAAMARADVRTNSGIIVNRDNVVVVDSPLLPSWGRDLVAEIRKITDKPVRYVINTHYHSDHVYGNQAILEAYGPNVDFIAQSFTRTDILNLDIPGLPKTGQNAPVAIARLEKELADGKDPQGNALDAGTRTAVQGQLAVQKGMLSEYQQIHPVPPTMTYQSELVLHMPDRDIELRHPNRAHTRGDTLVFLPKEKVLFTGDAFATSIPNMGSSYPVEWIDTVAQMRQWDWDTVVTGHEGIQHGKEHLDRWGAYLTDLVAKVREASAKGMTLEQAQKSIDLSAYAKDFPNFKLFNPTAVARAWAEVNNQIKD
jgi:cyclase